MSVSPTADPERPVLLLWTNYGPYHYARAEALAALCNLLPCQLSSAQLKYGWTPESTLGLDVYTVVSGSWEDHSGWKVARKLLQALQSANPRVLIIPGFHNLPTLAAAIWAKARRRRTILMYDSTEEDRPRHRTRERIKGLLVRALFDRASVSGHRSLGYLQKLGFAPKAPYRYGKYYDVVDNNYFTNGVRSVGSGSSFLEHNLPAKYILYVGRLAPEKNLARLLDAFADYLSKGGKHDLVLVGSGPLRTSLELQKKALNIENRVHLAGFKNGKALLPFYAFASCLVLPSISEPWGLVVNEAMASKLPIIVSCRCGCTDDLVEQGINGFLIDPTNTRNISDTLTHFDSLSPTAVASMGARSLERIATYSPDNWAREIAKLISN